MREHGSGTRHVVEMDLENAGFKLKFFKNVMNLDSTEAIKSAVEVGLGIGFVSRWAIFKELELGTLKVAEVAGLRVVRHFSLIPRTGRNRKVQRARSGRSRSGVPGFSPVLHENRLVRAIPADKHD